jgi:hypothetical protein
MFCKRGIYALGALWLGLLVLPFHAAAAPFGSMGDPVEIPLEGRAGWIYDGHESSADEPLTPGSGSACSGPGGDAWTLASPRWYYFVGTGDRVVVRVDGDPGFGMAVYKGIDLPTTEDALNCVRYAPRRYEVYTIPGEIYRVQVGAWEDYSPSTEARYSLSVFPKTAYGEPGTARPLGLNETFKIGNWGAPLEEQKPSCKIETVTYVGERSAWGRVDVPLTGTLHVSLEPEMFNLGESWMILLYPAGGGSPIACTYGSAEGRSRTIDLSSYLAPGSYLLRFTRAFQVRLDFEGSVEESWNVATAFTVDLDVDNDGFQRPTDCDDTNPAVHPRVEEVLDDGVDQNCDGVDARRDSDGDSVPDYRDSCTTRPTKGVDADGNGCPDPRQLPLTTRVLLALRQGHLYVQSLLVRTVAGARVTVQCSGGACEGEAKRAQRKRLRFDGLFDSQIPHGTIVTVSARKAGSIGISKRYSLSSHGATLVREWCTMPSKSADVVACE